MSIALAAAAIIIVAVVLHLRLEKILMLNFTRINAATSNLETNANPGETAADQAQLDQLAARLEAVDGRFAAPAPEAPADAGTAEANVPADQSVNPDASGASA